MTTEFLPIPWSQSEKDAMDRDFGNRGDRGFQHCLFCGRKTKGMYWVHEVDGGGVIAPADFEYTNEAADLGWWEVGPECRKRLPDGYVAITEGRRPPRSSLTY